MADFVSHHLFGEQALTVFPASVQQLVASHPVSFRWGCQGPDPLFYRKILLGSPLHKLGNRMHSEKIDELFIAFARGVHDLTGEAQQIAAAYFYGFVCHCCHKRGHYAGRHAGNPVYRGTAQRSHRAVHDFHLFFSGYENLIGAYK